MITLEDEKWKIYIENCYLGCYQAARFFWTPAYNDPAALLNLLISDGGRSGTFYHNPMFDHWMARTLQAVNEAERYHCYQQAEALIAEDVPLLPLYHGAQVRFVKPYVGGLSQHNLLDKIYTKDLYLIKYQQAPSRYRQ